MEREKSFVGFFQLVLDRKATNRNSSALVAYLVNYYLLMNMSSKPSLWVLENGLTLVRTLSVTLVRYDHGDAVVGVANLSCVYCLAKTDEMHLFKPLGQAAMCKS